jgi:hypothetical protein
MDPEAGCFQGLPCLAADDDVFPLITNDGRVRTPFLVEHIEDSTLRD